jgi:hypothetical protein
VAYLRVKSFCARILISERTYGKVQIIGRRELFPFAVKGIEKSLQLFTVGAKA